MNDLALIWSVSMPDFQVTHLAVSTVILVSAATSWFKIYPPSFSGIDTKYVMELAAELDSAPEAEIRGSQESAVRSSLDP